MSAGTTNEFCNSMCALYDAKPDPYPVLMGNSSVDVHFFAAARAAAGCDQTTAQPGSLATVLAELSATYPDLAAVLPRCSYLHNEVAVHGEVELREGDRLDILPPFAGG